MNIWRLTMHIFNEFPNLLIVPFVEKLDTNAHDV